MNAQLETGLTAVTVIAASYLIGSIPFGLIIGKLKGKDIRKEGSGNIGATNVTRVIGKGWGKLCFTLDFLKGALPVLIVSYLTPKALFPFLTDLTPVAWQEYYMNQLPDPLAVLPSLAAFAAVSGHIWPIYLKFKGGKGVSTAAGAILALNPLALIGAALVWVITFFASRYVCDRSFHLHKKQSFFPRNHSLFPVGDPYGIETYIQYQTSPGRDGKPVRKKSKK